MLKFMARGEDGKAVLGTNATTTGTPAHASCKFGNGFDSNTATNRYVFPAPLSTAEWNGAFIIDKWWKPSFSSTDGTNRSILSFEDPLDLGYKYCWVFFNYPTAGKMYVWCRNERGGGGTGVGYKFDTSFTSGTVYHLAVALNPSASATNRVKLYLNGVSQTYNSNTQDGTWTMPNPLSYYSGYASGIGFSTYGVSDNVKVHVGTDIDSVLRERFNERGRLNDIATIL